jgi:predicted tellurium resistance membrane protein TerC
MMRSRPEKEKSAIVISGFVSVTIQEITDSSPRRPSIWAGLLTLIVLEIVLGIDNLVFIAILADKLPPP